MNRAFGMRCNLLIVFVVSLSVAACQTRPASTSADDDLSPPAKVPCCQYTVSGGVAHPGTRTLLSNDTVSTAIARDFPNGVGWPCTIVLIRQAPEGKTQQLIQLDADGKLINVKQDWSLRNGDELVFPGGGGVNSRKNPTGPPARTGMD